jgi:CubicO group peptidase (beta-lactamase class C family)
MFTAATVVKLAELGKLSLDDSLAKYFPDFPNASHIKLRELLNHTAGISDITNDPQPGFTKRDVDTAALIAEIRKRPPAFAPGTRWAYSNAGYILLGAVVEKVTGQSWHVALQKDLLEPAGLKQIRYGDNAVLILGRVAGYTTDNPSHRIDNASFISMSIPAAAGGLVSTADDLVHWMRALTGGRVVSHEGFQQMITPVPELPGVSPAHQYGMGMYIWRVRGSKMVGHTGQIDGFTSAVTYLPKQDITVVVLANNDNFDAQTMCRRLAAIALGEPYPDPLAVMPSDEMLLALEGEYRIDEAAVETLSIKDHQLYAQRGHRNIIPLQMTAGQQLHFVPDELSYFVPARDSSGKVTRLDYFEGGDAPPKPLPRVLSTGSVP